MLTVWTALAALAALDITGCYALHVSFTDWFATLAALSVLAAVSLFYHHSGRSERIAAMTHWVMVWIVFSLLGIILSYLAAARGAPWRDAEFAALDAALGFDWHRWAVFVAQYPVFERLLALAYTSLMPQILVSVAYFAFRGRDETNQRLLLHAFIALLLTAGIFSFMPAVGPMVYFLHLPEAYDFYFRDLQGLHDRTLLSFAIPELKGIVCVPSFHTVLAILVTEAHRRSPLFVPVAILNTLMLISIPNEGGHYLIDVVAGAGVAGLTLALADILRRCRRASPAAAA
jgi:hypothetical protein